MGHDAKVRAFVPVVVLRDADAALQALVTVGSALRRSS
jgi:hypothetical protein